MIYRVYVQGKKIKFENNFQTDITPSDFERGSGLLFSIIIDSQMYTIYGSCSRKTSEQIILSKKVKK
jgi:hypothetical protein